MARVSWFEGIGIADRPSVGGKGASLGELTRAGFRVPPGFVVTTAAFESFLAALDPDGAIRAAIAALDPADSQAVAVLTADVRARIEGHPLPDEVQAAIGAAYGRLCGESGAVPVAVRSSATSEDSADASFAGLQDTYLWVRGVDDVAAMTRKCWASLYSDPSVLYRLRLRLAEKDVAMGVVVQRMVDARCAGVMFTRSPTTGDLSVVAINASWGLGSSVVSGEVTPDDYVVSKVTGQMIRRTVSAKLVRHVPDPAGGIREEPVPEDLQRTACLSDDELAGLVDVAKRTERHYGTPQDIEWAIARDGSFPGNLFMLQSRPETVWKNRRVEPIEQPKANPFDHVLNMLGARKGGGSG